MATARALADAGIEVHALEPNSDLPGFYTRRATVHQVSSIHPPGLIEALVAFADERGGDDKIALFPINDTMVADIARNWSQLAHRYALSWSASLDDVSRLLLKENLEPHTVSRGLDYPKSRLLETADVTDASVADLRFPLLAKPSKPLGSFKTRKVSDLDALKAIVRNFEGDLPLLVQEWIEGGDTDLYFCALFLVDGEDIGHFVGRKLRSQPPAQGQTTSAAPFESKAIYEVTKTFFSGTTISGPVSLEVKRDPEGRYWIIEPTVGRTDFWLDLCVQNGFDLPLMNYEYVTGVSVTTGQMRGRGVNWFDTDRDSWSFLSLLSSRQISLFSGRRFTFFDRRDLAPWWFAVRQQLFRRLNRVRGRREAG
ncbi:MAG: hypothetical protein AAFY69_08405 [Pseudomonadota bacterium]